MRAIYLAAGLYLAVAVVTFGHCAANGEAWKEAAGCYDNARWDESRPAGCFYEPWLAGFGASILWPLYWSWELWS